MNDVSETNTQPSTPDEQGNKLPETQTKPSNKKWFLIGGGAVVFLCACTALCIVVIGFGGISIWKERAPIQNVIDAFMQAMEARDTETAYALFSVRVQRQIDVSSIEEMQKDNNYVLFSGYQSVEVLEINISEAFNTNPDEPQGTVATVTGTVYYDNDFTGKVDAVLEREGDEWKLHYIYVTVPPNKLQP